MFIHSVCFCFRVSPGNWGNRGPTLLSSTASPFLFLPPPLSSCLPLPKTPTLKTDRAFAKRRTLQISLGNVGHYKYPWAAVITFHQVNNLLVGLLTPKKTFKNIWMCDIHFFLNRCRKLYISLRHRLQICVYSGLTV